jgi:hypothetical protein
MSTILEWPLFEPGLLLETEFTFSTDTVDSLLRPSKEELSTEPPFTLIVAESDPRDNDLKTEFCRKVPKLLNLSTRATSSRKREKICRKRAVSRELVILLVSMPMIAPTMLI